MMKPCKCSRRHFVQTALQAAAVASFPRIATGREDSDVPIRIGLIGCGGRGTGAALDALRASTTVIYPTSTYHTEDAAEGARVAAEGVHVVALADVFEDRLERCRRQLQKVGMPVSEDRCFMGGRQVRTEPRFGNIYDHFALEYQYASGVRCFAMDRQMRGCVSRVEEIFLGPKGTARFELFRGWGIDVKGGERWRFSGQPNNPYHQEHEDLINSIRSGQPINEARQLAESTLTAIIGREATYSGQIIQWDDALNSKQDRTPAKYEFGPLPMAPVPMPGQYELS